MRTSKQVFCALGNNLRTWKQGFAHLETRFCALGNKVLRTSKQQNRAYVVYLQQLRFIRVFLRQFLDCISDMLMMNKILVSRKYRGTKN